MVKAKAPKSFGTERGPPPLPNRDVFHRINFAYQSAALLQQLTPSSGASGSSSECITPAKIEKRKKKARGQVSVKTPAVEAAVDGGGISQNETSVQWGSLARKGTKEMKKMAVHTQVKIDPSIKRAICKGCSTVLIPGMTCRVRDRPSKIHTYVTHYTCISCQTIRTIPNPPLTPPIVSSGAKGTPSAHQKSAKSKKAAFHEREQAAAVGAAGVISHGEDDGVKGHSLWRGEKAMSGWGAIAMSLPEETRIS